MLRSRISLQLSISAFFLLIKSHLEQPLAAPQQDALLILSLITAITWYDVDDDDDDYSCSRTLGAAVPAR